jgi:NTP pyrophosphatase (non-canonical NTP hydrolase)
MDNSPYMTVAAQYMDDNGALTPDAFTAIALGFEVASRAIYLNNVAKGWWENPNRNFGEVLALIHSEVSEALEAYRDGDDITDIAYEYPDLYEVVNDSGETVKIVGAQEESTLQTEDGEIVLGKPVGVASELADVIIRILDVAEGLNIPVTQALIEKHQYNQTRPYRHGGKKA